MATPMPYADVLTGAQTAITNLGLNGFMIAGLLIVLAAAVFRRFGGKGR
jgi:hypothetical protein